VDPFATEYEYDVPAWFVLTTVAGGFVRLR
jgi:hypothetical protein